MDLVRQAALALLLPAIAFAQGLSLTIGNSVASQNYAFKSAEFMFRLNGCADPATAHVSATAESVGHSGTLQFFPLASQPGVYAIPNQTSSPSWLAVIAVTCRDETTAALIPMSGQSFNRDGIQMLPHTPTKAEIDAALKKLPAPPAKPQ